MFHTYPDYSNFTLPHGVRSPDWYSSTVLVETCSEQYDVTTWSVTLYLSITFLTKHTAKCLIFFPGNRLRQVKCFYKMAFEEYKLFARVEFHNCQHTCVITFAKRRRLCFHLCWFVCQCVCLSLCLLSTLR